MVEFISMYKSSRTFKFIYIDDTIYYEFVTLKCIHTHYMKKMILKQYNLIN